MGLSKNVASQKWIVFAFARTTSIPKTGDGANITAQIIKNGGSATAIIDTNPTELQDGFYVFDLTQAETNADHVLLTPESTTADIQIIGVPAAVWTSLEEELKTTTDAILVDTGTTLPASLADIDTDVNSIINTLTLITPGSNTQPSNASLTLTRGDAYDAVSNAKLSWTVSQSVSAATHGDFTIRGADDRVILDQDTTGVTVTLSGTTFTVALTSAATILLTPGEHCKFDCEVHFSATSRWTVVNGLLSVLEDQSRD